MVIKNELYELHKDSFLDTWNILEKKFIRHTQVENFFIFNCSENQSRKMYVLFKFFIISCISYF